MPFNLSDNVPYEIVLDLPLHVDIRLPADVEHTATVILDTEYDHLDDAIADAKILAQLYEGIDVHVQLNGFIVSSVKAEPMNLQPFEGYAWSI